MAIEPGAVATELTDHITRPDVKQAAEQMYNRWPAAGPLGATAGTAGVLVRDRIPVVTSLAFLTPGNLAEDDPLPLILKTRRSWSQTGPPAVSHYV